MFNQEKPFGQFLDSNSDGYLEDVNNFLQLNPDNVFTKTLDDCQYNVSRSTPVGIIGHRTHYHNFVNGFIAQCHFSFH